MESSAAEWGGGLILYWQLNCQCVVEVGSKAHVKMEWEKD